MGEIGRTGVRVPKIGFGTSGLGEHARHLWLRGVEERAREATSRCLDQPVDFLDSSRNYGSGRSEERIGDGGARAGRLPEGRHLDQARPRHGDLRFDAARRAARSRRA